MRYLIYIGLLTIKSANYNIISIFNLEDNILKLSNINYLMLILNKDKYWLVKIYHILILINILAIIIAQFNSKNVISFY